MGHCTFISLVAVVLGWAAPCGGQAVPPASPVAALQLDAAVGLKEISRAYRTGLGGAGPGAVDGAKAERMTLTLREGGKVVRRDEFVCRVSPTPGDGLRAGDADLSLELGPLRVYASGGMLVVTHVSKAETFFRQDYEPPLSIDKLAAIVPPLLLPQLAFALSAEPPTVLASYCRGVRWRATSINAADEQPVLTVTGTTERNQVVSLVADGKTGRLRSLSLGLEEPGAGGAGAGRILEAAITPVAVEPLAKWMPVLAGRRLVGSLDKLTVTVDRQVELGQRFPAIVLHSAGHEKARLEDLAALTSDGGVMALVMFDAPDDAGLADAAADACAAAKIVRDEARRGSITRTVAVIDAGTAITEAVKERAWRALTAVVAGAAAGAAAERDALWTTPRGASLGRLAPDQACAVVFLGSDLSVRGIVPVRAEDFAEGSTLAQRVKAAIGALASQPAPSLPTGPSREPVDGGGERDGGGGGG